MRVHVLGGFLGAGKTTLARALAEYLSARGERVAVVTNDQGHALVDTALCRGSAEQVREISGGCFCCRYDELETALFAAADAGATVAIAEAVGSCTDLVATVLAPLADRHSDRFQLAPLAIVVDPWRVTEIAAGRVHEDVAYLFRKQIEEADVVLLSRADRSPPDVRAAIHAIRANAAVVAVSGTEKIGLGEWLAQKPERPASPLMIDYDRYAAAEALLGWCNARVRIVGETPFSPAAVAEAFLARMADAPIAHLKLTGLEPEGGRAALVRAGDAPSVHFEGIADAVREARWLVNARVALEPAALVARLKDALAAAAAPALVEWEELEAFQPSRPVPQHRYSFRCGSGDDASCCAAFYDRADVRALLGDSWHPGGVALTHAMADKLALAEGHHILDVACGKGTSLRAVLERFPVTATGMDAQARGENDGRAIFFRGDAHAMPFEDAKFDALLCECALSTFYDQPAALREMRRVLRPGGRVAISDMAVEGEIPDSLKDWVHTGTCLARALTGDAYARALEDAGFRIVDRWDASDGLRELLRRIKRNLVGAAFAAASGQLGDVKIDVKHARGVIREAERAIDAGTVKYTALVAERPA
ncbi:MAG: methyltransferase domain-containing protein [Myxococcales bacterium]|nr:methyltransferase domain-containing protein [Myxococcales bacterium]